MFFIALWFGLLVSNLTRLIVAIVEDSKGWDLPTSLVLVTASTYFLLDDIRKEFFNDRRR